MSTLTRFGFLSLFLFYVASAGVGPAGAKSNSFKVTVKSAYLRAEPRFDAPPVASVFKGQVLPIISRTADAQWIQAGLSRVSEGGWISATLGTFDGDLESLPVGTVASSPPPTPTAPAVTNTTTAYGELGAYPVVPAVNARAREIYQNGLKQGTQPKHFSKIGDCQSVPSHFLSNFDRPSQYRLGKDYAYLQETLDYFSGSFSRSSEAVRSGFNIASVLSPLWADPKACRRGETPLQCEFRLHNPSIVFISMETWWTGDPTVYEAHLRSVVEFAISRGALPIIGTKADNIERTGAINAAVVRVAREYDVPLWNFWLAAQPLPNHGLMPDAFHLTFGRSFFDDPGYLQRGWTVRNLTALQALDAVWRGVR